MISVKNLQDTEEIQKYNKNIVTLLPPVGNAVHHLGAYSTQPLGSRSAFFMCYWLNSYILHGIN